MFNENKTPTTIYPKSSKTYSSNTFHKPKEKKHDCTGFKPDVYISVAGLKEPKCEYCGHKVIFIYKKYWRDRNGNPRYTIDLWAFIKSFFLPRTIIKRNGGVDYVYFPRFQFRIPFI